MKYALVKNAQLGNLLDRDDNSSVMWTKYGFNPEYISRLCVQGENSNGDNISLLPIADEALFISMLPGLQASLNNTVFPDDSVELVSDQAEIDAIKADVGSIIEAKKLEAQSSNMMMGDNGEMALILKHLTDIKAHLGIE
jgi:hypothetical protein